MLPNPTIKNNIQSPADIQIWRTAVASLGVCLVPPSDDPELGCAISVNMLFEKTFPSLGQIGGGTSTYGLLQALIKSPYFIEITEMQALPGDIIMAATGTSTLNGTPISNGHVGIMAEKQNIMSNESATGLWTQNYTLPSFIQHYQVEGGYPVRFFRPVV